LRDESRFARFLAPLARLRARLTKVIEVFKRMFAIWGRIKKRSQLPLGRMRDAATLAYKSGAFSNTVARRT
jgi:hypothetical protein